MPQRKPIETFGVFSIHSDGTVTTTDGRRPADLLVQALRATKHSVDEDMAIIGRFKADYEHALMRAGTYAKRGRDFRPLPLAMCYQVRFETPARRVDA